MNGKSLCILSLATVIGLSAVTSNEALSQENSAFLTCRLVNVAIIDDNNLDVSVECRRRDQSRVTSTIRFADRFVIALAGTILIGPPFPFIAAQQDGLTVCDVGDETTMEGERLVFELACNDLTQAEGFERLNSIEVRAENIDGRLVFANPDLMIIRP